MQNCTVDISKVKTSYKESGIAWLGKIPEHWEVVKIKYIFHETSIKKRGKEEPLAATQIYGVIPKKLYPVRTVEAVTSDLDNFKFVKNGDFVISLRSFEGGIEYSKYQGIISPAYTVLESVINISSLYFQFFFKSSLFISAINLYKTGIREGQNISYSELQQDFLPLPPLSEQQTIANYLDKKCTQIELLIAKKEKMITLLKEKKQSLINEVVTKGLDKTVQLKESGVRWLGKIPEHWEVVKIKYLARLYTGNSIKESDKNKYYIQENSIPYIATKDIMRDTCYVNYMNGMFILKDDLNFKRASKESILLCIEGGSAGRKVAFLNQEVCFVNKLCCINIDKISHMFPKQLFYFLQSKIFYYVFSSNIKGLIGGVTAQSIGDFQIPLPPLSEQQVIAQYLDEQCGIIDRIMIKTKEQVTLLKEYKIALINEAVCGRIDIEV